MQQQIAAYGIAFPAIKHSVPTIEKFTDSKIPGSSLLPGIFLREVKSMMNKGFILLCISVSFDGSIIPGICGQVMYEPEKNFKMYKEKIKKS